MGTVIRISDYLNKHRTKSSENRDTGKQLTVMFKVDSGIRAFTYKYLETIREYNDTGDIELRFSSGKVLIKGKDLNQLLSGLSNHTLSEISMDMENIDDIIITLYRD